MSFPVPLWPPCALTPPQYRRYFGDGPAFYIAWMKHYTLWLIIPAAIGIPTSAYHILGASKGITVEDNPYAPFYAICMVLWAVAFTKFWSRTCAQLQMEWHGTLPEADMVVSGRQPGEPTRAGFRGTLRENPITGETELYYPRWKRLLKACVSWAVTFAMLTVAFLVMICSLNFQGYVRKKTSLLFIPAFAKWASPGQLFDPNGRYFFVPGLSHAVCIMNLNSLYRLIATRLTEWENHETDEEFESSLLVKRFFFEAFDCYIALVYLAFWERDVDMVRAELISLYMADCARRLATEALIPAVLQWVSSLTEQMAARRAKASGDKPKSDSLAAANIRKPEYEPFDDFLEMVIQFGYIVMFAAAMPSASAISIIYNIIELKSDTFKLCFLYRRPKANPAHGIGTWAKVLAVQTWLAVFTNLAIFGFSSEQMAQWTPSLFVEDASDHLLVAEGRGRWVVTALAAVEHLMVAAMVGILLLVPDVPADVRLEVARERYHKEQVARERQHAELQQIMSAEAGTEEATDDATSVWPSCPAPPGGSRPPLP